MAATSPEDILLQKIFHIAFFAAMALAPAAHGSVFTLTVDGCSNNSCGSGPFGSITVVQGINLNTVNITETLVAGEIFANSGAGDALGYTLDKTATLVAGSLTTGFTASGSDKFSTFGTFASTILCSGCGNGTSAPQLSGPVSFSLFSATGLTPQDFIKNQNGFYFAADIGVPTGGGMFATGNVASAGAATAPEPGTWLTLLSGFGLCGAGLRKRFFAQS